MAKDKKTTRIRSASTLWSLQLNVPPVEVNFSPYKHYTVLGYANGNVCLIDEKGTHCWEKDLGSAVLSLKIQEGKKRVVALTDSGRFVGVNFSGSESFDRSFGSGWASFETSSKAFYLWGWAKGALKLSPSGKEQESIDIPTPIFRCKFVSKHNQFFVVHDSISVASYDDSGNNLWRMNHPENIEVSGNHISDVESDDSGKRVAIGCLHKGVYIYNVLDMTLDHVDLEKMVSHVGISGDGDWVLIADAMRQLYLADKEANIVWSDKVHEDVAFCRLDKRGERALVLEKGGLLSCYKFHSQEEDRTGFLELADYRQVEKKRELWNISISKLDNPQSGILTTSLDGNLIISEENKTHYVYDSHGNTIWRYASLSALEGGQVLGKGDRIFLYNKEELLFLNPHDKLTRKKKHITFYDNGIHEVAIDNEAKSVLIFDKKNRLLYFEQNGTNSWKRQLKTKIEKLRLSSAGSWAVFQSADNVLHCLGLKSFEVDSVTIDESIALVSLSKTFAYVGSKQGTVYAVDREGDIQWQSVCRDGILEIVPLSGQVAIIDVKGRVRIFQEEGELLGEGQIHNSRSCLNHSGKDILEIVPDKKSVSCYKLIGGELVWKMEVPSVLRQMSVPLFANRIVIRDSQNLFYYYILGKPELQDERSSYLEF